MYCVTQLSTLLARFKLQPFWLFFWSRMNNNNSSTVATGCKPTLSSSTTITTTFPFQNELGTSLLFLLIYIFERVCEYKLKIPGLLGAILAGKVGVMLLVLESSLQVEVDKVKKVGVRAFLAALSGVVTPLLLSLLVCCVFYNQPIPVAIAVGSSLAPTSLGFSAKLLGKELNTEFGQIIAIAAIADDVLSLCLLGIVSNMNSGNNWYLSIFGSLGSILFALSMLSLCPTPLFKFRKIFLFRFSNDEEYLPFFYISLLVFLSLLFGFLNVLVGSSDLLGVFTAGLIVSHTFKAEIIQTVYNESIYGELTKVGTSLFFACTIGFSFPFMNGMFLPESLLKGLGLLFVALIGKMPTGLIGAKPLEFKSAMRFSAAMNGRGEFSFLIAKEAKDTNVISNIDYAASVWGIFASSVLAPFLFRCFKKNEDYEENEIGATDANGIEMNQVNLTREK